MSGALRPGRGYGYAAEFTMEWLVRSAVVSTVYGGTSEIIGRTYGLAEADA